MTLPGGDRIKETSATSGTASFVLTGAVSGKFRPFPASLDGKHVRYVAEHTTAAEAESGYGVYTHATKTLTRLYRYSPTPGGAAVSFSVGGLHVACTGVAADFLAHEDTVDPTVNDDITAGFLRGMEWVNTATPSIWKCLDHTDGAAVWVRIDLSGGDGTLEPTDDTTTSVLIDASTDGTDRFLLSDSAIAVQLRANAPVDTRVKVRKAGGGTITVSCQAAAGGGSGARYFVDGDDQGGSPSTTSFTIGGWCEFVCRSNSDDDSALFVIDGAGLSLPSSVTGEIDFTTAGITVPNGSAVSGTLTKASHGGGVYKTSGNCTITPAAGFCITLKLEGAHTVGAGGTAHSGANGDVVSVVCFSASNGDVKLFEIEAANVINLPTA